MAVDIQKLNSLMKQFVATTPDIQGAILVTSDGLPMATALPTKLDEERVSAMSAAILALGERIGTELVRGATNRVFIEGKDGYALLTSCSDDLVLLVLAHHTVKLGVLIYEIKRILPMIKRLVGEEVTLTNFLMDSEKK